MVETRPERKVIVIPAREKTPEEQERKKNLRVAAYCRVSTNSEEQLSSYENQLAYYTEKDHEKSRMDHDGGIRRRGHHRHLHQ